MQTYKVKVHPERSPAYLWGGADIDVQSNAPLILTMRVDDVGEQVVIKERRANGTVNTLGRLWPGETYSLLVKDLRGVMAECVDPKVDSYLLCTLTPMSSATA